MPYCTHCGSPVVVGNKFCTKCGTLLDYQLPPPPTNSTYFIGLSTKKDFSLGIQIGGCAAIVIVGLVVLSALYGMYWTQWRQLQFYGVNTQEAHYLLSDLATGMGFCAFAAIFASYYLFHAVFIQLNPTMRTIMSNGLNRARLGIAFVTGGMYSFSLSALQYFMTLNDSFSWFQLPTVFAVVGLIMLPPGLLLLANAYLRSRKQATKV